MSIPSVLLACCLAASTTTTGASAGPSFDATALVGVWELTGVGDGADFVGLERMTLAFDSSGGFRMSVWEEGDLLPKELTGRYATNGDLLRLTVPDSPDPWEVRVEWSPSTLVLRPVDSVGARPVLPLRFEKRPWIAP